MANGVVFHHGIELCWWYLALNTSVDTENDAHRDGYELELYMWNEHMEISEYMVQLAPHIFADPSPPNRTPSCSFARECLRPAREYRCPGCGKRYAVRTNLKGHAKTCGTREYLCDCGTL
ncbi:uncharacterized protein LOC106804285 [Setaria italica]|uniref:uncharacterized protein LOC106804285 n=1 Tax=Setaria italica TaxID=4555 RepID=UPI0007199C70|nr:uncharacterized protein LOC106804285 [Setaria italica]